MFKLISNIDLKTIAKGLSLQFKGDGNTIINNVSNLQDASCKSLVFSKGDVKLPNDTVLISLSDNRNKNLIITENPRFDFIRALNFLENKIGFIIDVSTPVIPSCVKLGKNVVIENGVKIGLNTIIEHNVVIFSGTKIGNNCLIRANTTIGSDGFGFERDCKGKPVKFIHLGGVHIGNNVEIGSNVAIAKGTLSNTIIEDDVKIDNLVHVAHNCVIKKGAFVIASSVLCGGVNVGKNAWVAPNSTVSQKVNIGDKSIIGLGAVVRKDVEQGSVVVGNPAKLLKRI